VSGNGLILFDGANLTALDIAIQEGTTKFEFFEFNFRNSHYKKIKKPLPILRFSYFLINLVYFAKYGVLNANQLTVVNLHCAPSLSPLPIVISAASTFVSSPGMDLSNNSIAFHGTVKRGRKRK
jgi:hypothetical protein